MKIRVPRISQKFDFVEIYCKLKERSKFQVKFKIFYKEMYGGRAPPAKYFLVKIATFEFL